MTWNRLRCKSTWAATWTLQLAFFFMLFAGSLRASTGEESGVYAPQAPLPTPRLNQKELTSFEDLRDQVIELISSSRRRVWLMTDYLTDGDVVSALYLAKYRKIDVRVFLGRTRQNDYLSRLNYLKAQNIPVFVRPEHGFVSPTLLFVDQKLFTINRDLNSLQKYGRTSLAQVSPSDVKAFVSWFRDIVENPEPAQPRPEMRVGRPTSSPNSRTWSSEPVTRQESSYQGEDNGSYNYDKSRLSRHPPEGVSTQLPKVPRWKKIRDNQGRGEAAAEPLPMRTKTQGISPTDSTANPSEQSEAPTGPEPSKPGTIELGPDSKEGGPPQ